LPEIVVVDGGPDFDSVHFTTMLATLSITRIQRPPEDPRFGKEIERLFGAFKECFARGLPGFTPGIAHSRKVSGAFSPAKRAELRFHEIVELLEAYTFQGYNLAPKPGCLETRQHLSASSAMVFPFSGRKVDSDIRFFVLSAVEAPADSYQLVAHRGVRVYGTTYSCPALLSYRGPKKTASVKIEPFDSSIVYVCLDSTWHVCRSTNAVVHDALALPELLERTSEHLQLRHLATSMAREAQQAAYESKKARLASMLDWNKEIQRNVSTTPQPNQLPSERPPMKMDDIGDLAMEDDST
jgi:putative transposase